MILEEDKIREEMRVIVKRILKEITEYEKKYSIVSAREIDKQVYFYLSNAYVINGKILCRYFEGDGVFKGMEECDLEESFFKNIREAVKLVLENYDERLASDVENMIERLRNHSKTFMSSDILEQLKVFERSIKLENYIENHEEVAKVEEILSLIERIEEIHDTDLSYVHEVIGAKYVIEHFEEAIKMIPKIEDRHLKAAILEYFREYLLLEELL
ncbi:MAG: hypothetical protein Q4D02_00960 [Clostridia bacterium]|nr:hypothetical protein [Clostridia bacterium]